MLDPKCTHRKKCKCFDDRSYWRPFLDEAAGDGGMTLERMGQIFGTTRMGQCTNVKHAMMKLRGFLDERGIRAEDVSWED
jgi:hypothetical protein